ncbi:MAG: fructose-specific PTS transporter subunit EIIC [Alphaproteobacteria bacterium]|jgi:PTS system fructose-specific IIC component|nr:fructose-specific PTS transporter subunit EIIC [Alphaproteobacteria bacterium]
MLLNSVIKENLYFIKLSANNKKEALSQMAEVLNSKGMLSNKDSFLNDVLARENLASTFMENSVAIPHAKSKAVKHPAIVLGISSSPIKNDTTEDSTSTAQIFFMLAVPESADNTHIELISQLATFLINKDFCENLLKINSKEDFISLVHQHSHTAKNNTSDTYDIVAVTACPVGIAHTYIAAEKLEQVANEMGYKIKVQTNGSIGIKNALTQKEIDGAKAVILACDIDIDDSMFAGKKVYKTPVAKAMKETGEVIKSALNTTTTYTPKSSGDSGSSLGFYKHLLSGVSFMIPFVVIGGILIAAAIALSGIGEAGAVVTNPFLEKMLNLGVLSFGLMVPILAGYIGYSIAGKPALAPAMVGGYLAAEMKTGFLGGILIGFVAGYAIRYILNIPIKNKTILTIMPILILPILGAGVVGIVMYTIGGYIADFMTFLTGILSNLHESSTVGVLLFSGILGAMIAVDMGGPINKVAFMFGASMIAAGVPTVMGVIAPAIAVPPLGMALATFMAPKKYFNEEKQAGKAAFFMGLIGITEGAIPFAAADPLRVIPSIIVGSSAAAMIAGFLGVGSHAPHGGPITLPVIDGKLSFLLALVVGVIITAVLVNALKKNKV